MPQAALQKGTRCLPIRDGRASSDARPTNRLQHETVTAANDGGAYQTHVVPVLEVTVTGPTVVMVIVLLVITPVSSSGHVS